MKKTSERRAQADRRCNDIGPPRGWKERRRTTERRIPEIEECEVSESEWQLYFGRYTSETVTTTDESTTTTLVVESAAEIFGRVRDR